MLYPFIYTRTKYHDYRVVISKSLTLLPQSDEQIFKTIARTMIDAEDSQLRVPSWALVKKNGYILWGVSILNEVLGENNKDKSNRPVRGFFGVIADSSTNKLPYSISFFKELYATYVTPIWDTYEQTEQVSSPLPPISGDEFITKYSLLNNDVNVEFGKCRIFPYGSDCKGLIEAVFATGEDCSIATNVHKKSRCIEFGKDKLSFMNVVGASDSGIRARQDIKVYVKEDSTTDSGYQFKDTPISIEDAPLSENAPVSMDENTCTQCGNIIFGDETICHECTKKNQLKKYLRYGLYGFLALLCIGLLYKGPSIWEAILSPKPDQEMPIHQENPQSRKKEPSNKKDPYLRTNQGELNIQGRTADHSSQTTTIQNESVLTEKDKENLIDLHNSPRLQKAGVSDRITNDNPSKNKGIENSETETSVEGTN